MGISKISVVTISYNQGRYLGDLFDSLKLQLHEGDEHIVLDPGSVDGSREIITERARGDCRIKNVFAPDLGPADGLNNGVRISSGDVICYVNSDDYLLPESLCYVRRFFADNPDIDVLVGSIKIMCGMRGLGLRGRVPDFPSPCRISSGVFQYYQQGTFFRRSAFDKTKGFNRENRTCWDLELIVDMAIAGSKFYVTSKPLGAFRLHDASITGSGNNTEKYLADKSRIMAKAIAVYGVPNFWVYNFLKIDARMNPVRLLKQFRFF